MANLIKSRGSVAHDFDTINHFTELELLKAGVILSEVEAKTLVWIDAVREAIGRRIKVIRFHREGTAVDFYLHLDDGEVDNYTRYKLERSAVDVGFRGIGMYRNAYGYQSFHLDTRSKFTTWTGTKSKITDKEWVYCVPEYGKPHC